VSNPQHVQLALEALAPAGRTFYADEAPGGAEAPWVVGSLQIPASILAETGSHGGVARWRVTISGATAAQARVVAQECLDAWSEARVSLDGWTVGVLRHKTVIGPYAAGMTETDTDLRFQVVHLGFDLTVSRTPTA
jgi:hypothetical protein